LNEALSSGWKFVEGLGSSNGEVIVIVRQGEEEKPE